jgi:hypothetical protein
VDGAVSEAPPAQAGDVEHGVEPAEAFGAASHGGVGICYVGQIAGMKGEGRASRFLFDPGGERAAVFLVQAGDEDTRALARGEQSGFGRDAGRAGDEHDLAR